MVYNAWVQRQKKNKKSTIKHTTSDTKVDSESKKKYIVKRTKTNFRKEEENGLNETKFKSSNTIKFTTKKNEMTFWPKNGCTMLKTVKRNRFINSKIVKNLVYRQNRDTTTNSTH